MGKNQQEVKLLRQSMTSMAGILTDLIRTNKRNQNIFKLIGILLLNFIDLSIHLFPFNIE